MLCHSSPAKSSHRKTRVLYQISNQVGLQATQGDLYSNWGQGARKDLPGQGRLGDQTQYDEHPLAKQIVLPPANLLVLQEHVDREDVEEHKEGGDDDVHKRRGIRFRRLGRARQV